MTLYLLKYNNYYNRILKMENSLDGYLAKDDNGINKYLIGPQKDHVNFNPNDGILTSIVLNWDYDIPDYIVAAEGNTIEHRWFVIEAKRERKNQYSFTLRRDLLVDFNYDIMNSTCFIEKAILNASDRLILNKEENMTYNQIKSGETLLKDKTNSSWLVGYVSLKPESNDLNTIYNSDHNDIKFSRYNTSYIEMDSEDYTKLTSAIKNGTINTVSKYYYNIVLNGDSWTQDSRIPKTQVNSSISNTGETSFTIVTRDKFTPIVSRIRFTDSQYDNYRESYSQISSDVAVSNLYNNVIAANSTISANALNDIKNDLSSNNIKYSDPSIIDIINKYNNRLVKVVITQNNTTVTKFFNIRIDTANVYEKQISASTTLNTIKNYFVSNNASADGSGTISPYERIGGLWWDTGNYGNLISSFFNIKYIRNTYNASMTEIESVKEYKLDTINFSKSKKLVDAPYKVFAIPLNYVKAKYTNANQYITLNHEVSTSLKDSIYSLSTMLSEKFGSIIYDIQILPYCPTPELIDNNGYVNLNEYKPSSDESTYYNLIYDVDSPNKAVNIMVWCDKANNSILLNDSKYKVSQNIDNLSLKIENETTFYRLCSPNYNGCFEFSATKNDGISGYEANWTLKPYTPYLHVNPIFGGLYGKDYNDQRGLVCSGQFSIPLISNKWTEYQIQNSSYMNAFNREITNMETTYGINRQQQQLSGTLNAITTGLATGALVGGSVGGAMGGGIAGSIGGGIAGAAAGTAAYKVSMWGLEQDLKYSDQLHSEALSYAKDQFGYQLQNIKALPYSISNIGVFDVNSKIFPFVEKYTCTDIEKKALEDKIIMNGMLAMVIGKPIDYFSNGIEKIINSERINDSEVSYTKSQHSYIQAQLISCETLNDDYHIMCELASELHKGVRAYNVYTYTAIEKD